jgi:hypothetical protein
LFFIATYDLGQLLFLELHIFNSIRSSENWNKGLDEEKPQSRTTAIDGARRQLPIAKQVHLILTHVAWARRSGERWKSLEKSVTAWM